MLRARLQSDWLVLPSSGWSTALVRLQERRLPRCSGHAIAACASGAHRRWPSSSRSQTYAAARLALAGPARAARARRGSAPPFARRSSDSPRLSAAGRVGRGPQARICWRARRTSAFAPTFATVIVERLLDLVAVLLLFACSSVDRCRPRGRRFQRRQAGRASVAAVGAIGALLILFLCAGHPERLGRWAAAIVRVAAGPDRAALVDHVSCETFAEGLAVMRRPGPLVLAAACSDSAVAVDRARHLAHVAGVRFDVSVRGHVPGRDVSGRGRRGAHAGQASGAFDVFLLAGGDAVLRGDAGHGRRRRPASCTRSSFVPV